MKTSLGRFLNTLFGLLNRLLGRRAFPFEDTYQPPLIDEGEVLARFLFRPSSEFVLSKDRVKPKAFIPPKNGRLSVFRKSRMSSEEFLRIRGLIKREGKDVQAAALVAFNAFLLHGLRVMPEESDHKWHADVIDWPDDKSKVKLIAQELAEIARLEEY